MLDKEKIRPNIQGEIEELQRVVQYLNRDEGVDISTHDLVNAFQDSEEEVLSNEVWSQLENTESNTIEKGDFDVVLDIARKYKKSNPIKLAKKLKSGDYERPMIVKFGNRYHLVSGNTRLCTAASLGMNPKVFIASVEVSDDLQEKWSEKYKKSIDCDNPKGFSQRAHCQGKERDANESTGASSAGGYSAPAFGQVIKKKEITKIHNMTEDLEYDNVSDANPETDEYVVGQEIDEATVADSSGQYDAPFGDGSKTPLKINGEKSIKKSRAVRDKKWPKYGGPGGVYVAVKEKCKKYPYCNQGDINSLEFFESVEIVESVKRVSKKSGIPYPVLEKIVLNEIKKIFIEV